MEQHAVPQNISSYQFHLVGDMTLKQFLEIAGGVVVGVLFYATGLPSLIKWPLILISVGIGAALAFVPFEERPLEQWIFAFIRSIYSPTLFHWEKKESLDKYFQDETAPQTTPSVPTPSVFSKIPFLAKLEDTESSYLNKLSSLFTPTVPLQKTQVAVPDETPEPVAATPSQTTNIAASLAPRAGDILTMHGVSEETIKPMAPVTEKRDVQVPQTTMITVGQTGEKTSRPHIFVQEVTAGGADLTPTNVPQTLVPHETTIPKPEAVAEVKFSPSVAPPYVPTIPNTVSGQVVDSSGNVVEGVILEIKDDKGRAVRALRTSRTGSFLIVTPLTNGKYEIFADKEGYTFKPTNFNADGELIQPIAIRSN
ncbi:MAG TPA: PrgI family protein [Candidatus Saccharimonadales bacterium]|nr:PrgI family protein [Candidatus Saccharimonadales bacterium]